MYAIHHILVAIKDPRAKSHPAVTKAAAIASALDAKLQLFHAIDIPIYPDLGVVDAVRLPPVERRQRDAYQLLLEEIAAPLRRQGLAVTTAVEWDFPRHEAIIRSAARFGANLIVAADHATVHRVPWLLRYTDWELVRASPAPVLLVKSPRPYRNPVILAALDPARAFGKPATLDSEILRFSATLADALHGTVHAVHGYAAVPTDLPPAVLSNPRELKKILDTAQNDALAALSKAAQPLGVARARLHVEARHPTDAVMEVAKETGSQIVALGSISRSGVGRFFLGNTAEALIDRLECDILVVKPPEFRHKVLRKPRGARVVPLAICAAAI
ncbi:MAG TPA: universal stress protein [Steroidobacteraceae bacterium]|nr:universal stress protein [Steroidobacteraceae bacterium]